MSIVVHECQTVDLVLHNAKLISYEDVVGDSRMNKSQIEANPKSVRTLLSSVKYTVDTYQREYNWKSKQIAELLDDLKTRF